MTSKPRSARQPAKEHAEALGLLGASAAPLMSMLTRLLRSNAIGSTPTGWQYPLVVIDTETTGLPGDPWADVVELGAVCIDQDGSILWQWSTLVRPTPGIPDEAADAMAVHGIPAELILRRGVGKAEALDQLAGLCRRPVHAQQITSYGVKFDRHMLERHQHDHARLPRWGRCIHETAAALRPDLVVEHDGRPPRIPLRILAGLERGEQTHRALDDARTAARCVVDLELAWAAKHAELEDERAARRAELEADQVGEGRDDEAL